LAKGVSFNQAVLKHALRNSLIPIATTFGQNITLVVSGSFLIETVFDINGFGLLGLSSIFDRDYPVVMGVIFLASLLLLLGNILSDVLVALIDPRIRFK
jgi:microcin C transport system permease protein